MLRGKTARAVPDVRCTDVPMYAQYVSETKPNQEYMYRKKTRGYETLLILFLFLCFF